MAKQGERHKGKAAQGSQVATPMAVPKLADLGVGEMLTDMAKQSERDRGKGGDRRSRSQVVTVIVPKNRGHRLLPRSSPISASTRCNRADGRSWRRPKIKVATCYFDHAGKGRIRLRPATQLKTLGDKTQSSRWQKLAAMTPAGATDRHFIARCNEVVSGHTQKLKPGTDGRRKPRLTMRQGFERHCNRSPRQERRAGRPAHQRVARVRARCGV
jgi:hypothetical protein